MAMMEGRCYERHDFQVLVLQEFGKRRPRSPEETKRLQEEYLRLLEEIPRMWEEFVEKHKNIYERFGYLDVVVHDDLRVERKKLQRGRPKEEKSKSYRITVRLDDELYELLQKYCRTKNISESEAVRQLISELKWKRF
ncbi:ribbon-helix-helix protein, CopG family [Geobacillus stearothermophilus]|nr:ribbon-helix-helix protein, CopG family [Geobacillus stearothermophilus]MED4880743.1 ribbon-helix-helix protein, CopG family [Geobacillus stearothermophilus]MED4986858.1 ribbon-helix-helix protein, CopG family [Geobacillus stearothermophilus]MED5010668.1 ribbon-helix-helix protein, CopG family [Geobacillus stearothermophilus]MED5014719.1 ribbon-helix-helix protein, CopG family [Geobacillus stearothermophilus]MED5043528.1 ribbon-helix-helix protein, CopG family [Geobacillus stearothermophilu